MMALLLLKKNEIIILRIYVSTFLHLKIEIIENKLKSSSSDLEEEKDLISNFLASYVLSNADDQSLLNSITKYLNTWESFYNYCLISLKNNNFNESTAKDIFKVVASIRIM